MNVTVLLFALARDRAGTSELTVELAGTAPTVADLKAAMARACPALGPLLPMIRIAVDSEYATEDQPIVAGLELAAIPPVSGGASMIEITEQPIDHSAITERIRSDQSGAVCVFLGTVREMTGDRRTASLDYQAYPGMALKAMAGLDLEARGRWPIRELAIVHRVGHLELGEISVVVGVSTPHRDQAFEACRWLIDRLKQVVPIWKKEVWADGLEEWVHPPG